jgi:hypothetical protein
LFVVVLVEPSYGVDAEKRVGMVVVLEEWG